MKLIERMAELEREHERIAKAVAEGRDQMLRIEGAILILRELILSSCGTHPPRDSGRGAACRPPLRPETTRNPTGRTEGVAAGPVEPGDGPDAQVLASAPMPRADAAVFSPGLPARSAAAGARRPPGDTA